MSRKSHKAQKTFKCANCGAFRKVASDQGIPPMGHNPAMVHKRHAPSLGSEISLGCNCGHYTVYTSFMSER